MPSLRGDRRLEQTPPIDKDCDACAPDIETCLKMFPNDLTCLDNTGGATDTAGDGCEWSLRGVRKFVNQVENVLFF